MGNDSSDQLLVGTYLDRKCDQTGTHETKNIDTPIGPRSAKTSVAGKRIIPSRPRGDKCHNLARDQNRGVMCCERYVHDTPSRILSKEPKTTAGKDLTDVIRICLRFFRLAISRARSAALLTRSFVLIGLLYSRPWQ